MSAVLRAAATAAVAAVALAGCVRATADTTIDADGTFSQYAVIAFDPSITDQAAGLPGFDADLAPMLDMVADADAFSDLEERYPGQVSVDDYDDGELVGVEITVTDLPLDEFNAAGQQVAALGASAEIQVLEDSYVVTMTSPDELDLGGAGLTGANLDLIASSVDVAVTYTFPGLVREASAGEIDGRTVTLGLSDLASGGEITIVAGKTSQMDWGPWLQWGGIALAFALVIGGAAALIVQDRRRRAETDLPPPTVGGPASGPGMLSDNPPPGEPDGEDAPASAPEEVPEADQDEADPEDRSTS